MSFTVISLPHLLSWESGRYPLIFNPYQDGGHSRAGGVEWSRLVSKHGPKVNAQKSRARSHSQSGAESGSRMGRSEGLPGDRGCGSLTMALEVPGPPQTDGAQQGRRSSCAVASTSQEAYVDMEGQWLSKGTLLDRGHLVPTIYQLVPGTFISLLIGSPHSAAYSLHWRKPQLRMVKRPAQSHTAAEQKLSLGRFFH